MFVIYGTQGVTTVVGNGTFACPRCAAERPYLRKAVRRYFTLFFIPLIPLDWAGEYLECQFCREEFDDRVLVDYPAVLQAKAEAEFIEHLKRVMVHAALAGVSTGGQVSAARVDAISARAQDRYGVELSRFNIERDLNVARLAKAGLAPYPRRFEGRLEGPAKEEVIKAAFAILSADGELGDAERQFLEEIAAEMGLAPAHLRQLLADSKRGALSG